MRDIVTRGDLPHWFMPGAAHFITYRLVDTIPLNVMARLRAERQQRNKSLSNNNSGWRENIERSHKQFFADYDRYLDQGHSIRWLECKEIAKIVIDNLYHHYGSKYELLEYVVMPNHVHVLMVPTVSAANSLFLSDELADSNSPLTSIMHSLKSYTANEANKIMNREGRFWQRESYDHWVRSHEELVRIAEYIAQNPVRAKLVSDPCDWPYCSVYDRKNNPERRLPEWW